MGRIIEMVNCIHNYLRNIGKPHCGISKGILACLTCINAIYRRIRKQNRSK